MIKYIIAMSMLGLCSLGLSSMIEPDFPYNEYWKKVENFLEERKPQSALDVVEQIYDQAKKDDIESHLLRSIITQHQIAISIEEIEYVELIARMESEIENTSNPQVLACLQSATSSMYLTYLMSNYHRLADRVTLGELPDDSTLWSVPDIESRSDELMFASLNLQEIKDSDLNDYQLLDEDKEEGITLHPYLMQQGIYHFQNDLSYMSSVVDESKLPQASAFLPIKDYIKSNLGDQLHPKRRKDNVFYLYKQMLDYYKKSPAEQARLDVQRLQYANRSYINTAIKSEDNIYIQALRDGYERSKDADANALYGFYLAQQYYQLTHNYSNDFDQQYRAYGTKAYQLLSLLNPDDKSIQNSIDGLLAQLKLANITFNIDEVIIPNVAFPLKVNFKNVPQLHFKLVKLTRDDYMEHRFYYNNQDMPKKLLRQEALREWVVDLDIESDYLNHQTECVIDGLSYGYYALLIGENSQYNAKEGNTARYSIFQVSNQQVRRWNDQKDDVVQFIEKTSGKPIDNVTVDRYPFRNRQNGLQKLEQTYHSDNEGIIKIGETSDRNNQLLISRIGEDELITQYYKYYHHNNRQIGRTHVFMDRSIYRPGQTAQGKFLVLNRDNENKPVIVPNSTVSVIFRDANYQEISTQEIRINDYGAGEFKVVVPESGLKGKYTLEFSHNSAGRSTANIQVEEYRRPTLEGEIDKAIGSKRLGDQVEIAGVVNSLSGFPAQGAPIRYTVSEAPYIVWRVCGWSSRWYPPYQSTPKVIATGETATDQEGKFAVSIQSDTLNMKYYQTGKTYTITFTAIDRGGESITLTKTIYLTPKAYRIKHTIPQVLSPDVALEQVRVSGVNFDDSPVDITHEIKIKKYQSSDAYYRSRNYSLDHLLYSEQAFEDFGTDYLPPSDDEEFDTSFDQVTTTLDDLDKVMKKLPSGEYQFEIVGNHNGESVTDLHRCLVTQSDKVSPSRLLYAESGQQSSKVGDQFSPVVLVHTDAKNLYVQKIRGKEILEQYWTDRSSFLDQKFAVSQRDQGGFTIVVSTILKGDIETIQVNVEVPYIDTYAKLDLDIDSLLLPATDYVLGTTTLVDGRPLDTGSISLVMYDAALDAIYPHQWKRSFYPTFYSMTNLDHYGTGSGQQRYINRFRGHRSGGSGHRLEVIPRSYWYGIVNRHSGLRGGDMMYMDAAAPRSMEMLRSKSAGIIDEAEVVAYAADADTNNDFASNSASPPKTPAPRSNFGETVFFIPDGKTDAQGKYDLPFKTNDALTKWKILAFVYDKNMRYGFAEKVIRTQKEIQIIQTPTRSLYEGDVINWSTTIQNSSDVSATGTAEITIRSYLTQEDVTSQFLSGEQSSQLTIESNGSQTHTFLLELPKSYKDQVEIITSFTSSVGSDAEARRVPILSTQQFLTEGHPIWVSPHSQKDLNVRALDNADITTLRVELATNPFWLVARSFPMMEDRDLKITTNVSGNLYIESIANHIVSDYPEVERAYASAAMTEEKAGLSRNEDVKIQELNSTPWVRQAKRAETRTADFAKYFNLSESKNRLSNLQARIKSMQNNDGGYPWVQGGRSSLYTTQRVLLDLARLQDIGITNDANQDKQSIQSGLDYIDQQITKFYKKRDWDYVNYLMIENLYLYALLGDGFKAPGYHAKWLKILAEQWTDLSIASQAISGIIFLRNDIEKEATLIKESLEERAIARDDGTIFWRGINEYYTTYNQIGTQSFVINFLGEAGVSADIIDPATQWLLANKRSNEWYDNKATANVVHMLYQVYGSDMYQDADLDLSLNGENLDMEKTLTFATIDLDPDDYEGSLELSINNGASHPIFGGVYRQYFQPLDKIERHEAGENLSIKKTVYLKQIDGTQITYDPISDNKVEVGDELRVRLEIEAFDRMNYVYLSDTRPANTEPTEQLSRHDYRNGLYLYQSPSDIGQEFFIYTLPKGTHTLEYDIRVQQSGSFSTGLAKIQSFYAPEFSAFDTASSLESSPLSDNSDGL